MKTNKTMSKKQFVLIYSAVVLVSILLDQLTKVWMEGLLAGGKVINVIGDWMTFSWTLNHGAAFGSLKGGSVVFFICTVVGLPAFGYFWWRSRTRHVFGQIGFSFMIGGTIGNAIDRAFFADGFFNGGVRDFISVDGFAIFNVADCFLVVGVIMVCLALMFLDYDGVFVKSDAVEESDKQDDTTKSAEQSKTETENADATVNADTTATADVNNNDTTTTEQTND